MAFWRREGHGWVGCSACLSTHFTGYICICTLMFVFYVACMSLCLTLFFIFLGFFIARQHTYAQYWYSKSVCLSSVCLSFRYVPVPDENGLTYRHSFFTIGSPIILVLLALNIFTKFRRGHPCGALNTGAVEKIRDFLPISRNISQTIQDTS